MLPSVISRAAGERPDVRCERKPGWTAPWPCTPAALDFAARMRVRLEGDATPMPPRPLPMFVPTTCGPRRPDRASLDGVSPRSQSRTGSVTMLVPVEPGNDPGGDILRVTSRSFCRPPFTQTNRIHWISPVPNRPLLLPLAITPSRRNNCASRRGARFFSLVGKVRLPVPRQLLATSVRHRRCCQRTDWRRQASRRGCAR